MTTEEKQKTIDRIYAMGTEELRLHLRQTLDTLEAAENDDKKNWFNFTLQYRYDLIRDYLRFDLGMNPRTDFPKTRRTTK